MPINWFPVKNGTAEEIPAGALARVTGFDTDRGAAILAKPDADSQTGLVVVGELSIAPGSYGIGTLDNVAPVSYREDVGDPTPANGQVWGSAANEWFLRSAKKGFLILGGAEQGFVNTVRTTPTATAVVTVGPYLADVGPISALIECNDDGTFTATFVVPKTYKTQTLTVTAASLALTLPAPAS